MAVKENMEIEAQDNLQPEIDKKAKELQTLDVNSVATFGDEAQTALAEFSDKMILNIKNKDMGEIGDSLRDMVTNLSEADPDKLSGKGNIFAKMFRSARASIFEMTSKYQSISSQIDRAATQLSKQRENLIHDNEQLQEMFQINTKYWQDLQVLIEAGKIRVAQLDEQIASFDPNETDFAKLQTQRDVAAVKDRLEKRISDLQLTQQIAIQQSPQIRLVQNTNQALSEKIQSSITTAIPLWKNQVALALTLLRQEDAITAQNAVANTTNELLKKNSKMLKTSIAEGQKATQRGIVDIDTLRETQNDLVETIQSAIQTQQEGHQQRLQLESELASMNENLKDRLRNIGKTSDDTQGTSDK
ncbi:MAG: toxic anion resistance protein [Lactobacillaceae bacterium]|jgi:uncharacterized protein YaaN involved in tellurite resistance|nr:toxic anion resistance protein [Lactobacillaceae bacterium]